MALAAAGATNQSVSTFETVLTIIKEEDGGGELCLVCKLFTRFFFSVAPSTKQAVVSVRLALLGLLALLHSH